MKILAVDDDETIVELLQLILSNAGFDNVQTATTALIALDFITEAKAPYDCFLLDIQMPGIDGIELCALIRDHPNYKKTPIIILTAMTDKTVVQKAFDAGATDYATKPFEIFELISRLRLAERLVTEIKLATQQNETNSTVSVFESEDIDGVKGILGLTAFKNYIRQLSQSGRSSTQLFALQVHDVEIIFAESSPSEFIFAMEEVSEAIMDVLKSDQILASYRGNGIFLCLSLTATLLPSAEIECNIQENIDARDLLFDSGLAMDIEISVGNPVQLTGNAVERFNSLVNRVTKRVIRRRIEKQSTITRPNIRPTLLK